MSEHPRWTRTVLVMSPDLRRVLDETTRALTYDETTEVLRYDPALRETYLWDRDTGEFAPAPPTTLPAAEIQVRAELLELYLSSFAEAATSDFSGTPFEAAIKLWLVTLDEDQATRGDPFLGLRRWMDAGPGGP